MGPAPKDGAGAGFGGEGTVGNGMWVSASLLPKALPISLDLMLLLELHQKSGAAGGNIGMKRFYVIDPPQVQSLFYLKKKTIKTQIRKNSREFSCGFACLWS